MKLLSFLVSICFLPMMVNAQTITDDVFVTSDGIEVNVGDDLIIGYPTQGDGFTYIENDTKRKIGLAGKLAGAAASVGTSVALVGVGSGSYETVGTGIKVAGSASAVEGVAQAGDLIMKGENKLTGQRLRVLKFTKTGNARRGEHYFAIVAGIGKENYKIELERAIELKEVLGVNDLLFNNEDEESLLD